MGMMESQNEKEIANLQINYEHQIDILISEKRDLE
jgi:hypothetical protein